jgi:hypothetical protein
MTDSKTKTIDDWRIVPSSGNTVSLIGMVDGRTSQTSPICFARPGEVKTKNTQYLLGAKSPGVWEIQLEMTRQSQLSNLRRLGVL